jgi:type II secretory pathway component PulJ
MKQDIETTGKAGSQSGFSLVEFLVATLILMTISASVFKMLADTQRAASYQTEVQAVLENTRLAMDTLERIIRQAANNPHKAAFAGVTITSATEARFCADLTGSGSTAGQPDKGDPDGDIADAGEDITVRYDAAGRSLQLVIGGNAQPFASYIGAFNMQYLDANGVTTAVGANVRKIRVTVTGASTLRNPQTGQIFSMRQSSDIELAARV